MHDGFDQRREVESKLIVLFEHLRKCEEVVRRSMMDVIGVEQRTQSDYVTAEALGRLLRIQEKRHSGKLDADFSWSVGSIRDREIVTGLLENIADLKGILKD